MLFKLSLSNIRKSLRDYAIYFFTLIIGVSVFYVFNAIGGQAAMMKLSESQYEIIRLLESLLSGVSIFVACVLGLLIVYASRFLMKRRNKEFALYMTLGMSKGKISAILLTETILIGIGSLFVGLLIGIGLSQLMSALTASLFEVDMTAYQFTISSEAIVKTVVYFAVMYLVVMLFNSAVITRMKLIDLLQSGKKTEKIKLKNPVLCVLIFLVSAAALTYAYIQVGWHLAQLDQARFTLCIVLGCAATFFIFWSVSGMLLRIVMSMKNLYYRSLNAFTFRQISSKINTMVLSMTIICLMLFVTICTLASAFSIRNSLNSNLKEYCTADCEIVTMECDSENGDFALSNLYAAADLSLTDGFREYVHFTTYADPSFTLSSVMGDILNQALEQDPMLNGNAWQEIIRISDYNALCQLYGKDTITLDDGEYVLLCNFNNQRQLFDKALANSPDMTIFGKTLHARYDRCQDGFIMIGAQALNFGIFVVPDDMIDPNYRYMEYLAGNYAADTDEEVISVEAEMRTKFHQAVEKWEKEHPDEDFIGSINTKKDIYEGAVGLGAIVTFLGLYIGLVFLIACGAILALKELSESTDSISRYEMLRKIGVEEGDIERSLFVQMGIFFLLPLLLACIHSIFGMRCSSVILESIGTQQVGTSMAATTVIILLIYGGYFLITYFCSKSIIKERK